MRKTFTSLFCLFLLQTAIPGKGNCFTRNAGTGPDSVRIAVTSEVYPLASRWADEYNRQNNISKISLVLCPDNQSVKRMLDGGDNAIVSSGKFNGFDDKRLWGTVIARNVTVPVINSKNPFIDKILASGISPEAISVIVKNPGSGTWGTLLKSDEKTPVKYYRLGDGSTDEVLSAFLKTEPGARGIINVKSGDEMIESIGEDPIGIGFCNLTSVFDADSHRIARNIALLPLDRNGNGKLDYNEKIYEDYDSFSRGVWIGKYPHTLAGSILAVSLGIPVKSEHVSFLKWILSEGQILLPGERYSELAASEQILTTDRLNRADVPSVTTRGNTSPFLVLLVILAFALSGGLVLNYLVRVVRRKKVQAIPSDRMMPGILDEAAVSIPGGLYFDKTHTWAFMDQEGVVKVGVDDFLQHITGRITKIKMQPAGTTVKKGDPILTIIRNGKQLNLYSPVTGTIIGQNSLLVNDPSQINSSPYDGGWIYKMEPVNWHRENQLLFMAEKQKQQIREELARLKDFFVNLTGEGDLRLAPAVIQDGGVMQDGVLSDMGPEVWEEFQTKFIDPSRQLWFYEIF